MLSTRKPRGKKTQKGIPTEQEIIDGDLDMPVSLEGLWDIYRLGKKEEHLWMAQLTTPIPITAVAATHTYPMDFNFALTKLVLYQTDAAGDESLAAITLRTNIMHPNNTPSRIYAEIATVWVGGELTLTGKRYSPAGELQFVVSGTATNLLHVNIEFEVYGVA